MLETPLPALNAALQRAISDPNTNDALRELTRLADLHRQNDNYLAIEVARSEVLTRGGRAGEGLQVLVSLVRSHPHRPEGFGWMSALLLSCGEVARARSAFDKAVGLGWYGRKTEEVRAGLANSEF